MSPSAKFHFLRRKRWQSEEPPSPYEFLLNFGLPSEMLKTTLWNILAAACDSSEEPGFVDYLVRQIFLKENVPEPSFVEWKEDSFDCQEHPDERDECHTSLLYSTIGKKNQYEPSEEDVLSLFDLYSVRKDRFSGEIGVSNSLVQTCMRCSWRARVLHRAFDLVPHWGNRSSFSLMGMYEFRGCRQALDSACVSGLKRILPKLREIFLETKWTKAAFMDCLQALSSTSSLREVTLQVPDRFYEDADVPTDCSKQTHDPSRNGCGIEEARIQFLSDSVSEITPTSLMLLEELLF